MRRFVHDGRDLLVDNHASHEPVPGSTVWIRSVPWLVTVLVRQGADLVVAVEPTAEHDLLPLAQEKSFGESNMSGFASASDGEKPATVPVVVIGGARA